MLALDALKSLSESLGREKFLIHYPFGFLVRRAPPAALHPLIDDEESGPAALAFKTRVVDRRSLQAALAQHDEEGADDPADWTVVAIEKRKGNPYPERISVGRATNCDIVLRVDGVSKLHAHLYVKHDQVAEVVDLNSANGTYLNSTRLKPTEPAALRAGDKVRFGALELEFVTADALWEELVRHVPAAR